MTRRRSHDAVLSEQRFELLRPLGRRSLAGGSVKQGRPAQGAPTRALEARPRSRVAATRRQAIRGSHSTTAGTDAIDASMQIEHPVPEPTSRTRNASSENSNAFAPRREEVPGGRRCALNERAGRCRKTAAHDHHALRRHLRVRPGKPRARSAGTRLEGLRDTWRRQRPKPHGPLPLRAKTVSAGTPSTTARRAAARCTTWRSRPTWAGPRPTPAPRW